MWRCKESILFGEICTIVPKSSQVTCYLVFVHRIPAICHRFPYSIIKFKSQVGICMHILSSPYCTLQMCEWAWIDRIIKYFGSAGCMNALIGLGLNHTLLSLKFAFFCAFESAIYEVDNFSIYASDFRSDMRIKSTSIWFISK